MEICFCPAFKIQKQPKKLSGSFWKSVEIFLIVLLFRWGDPRLLSRLRTLLPEPVYLTFRRFSDSETSHLCNRMFCSIGLVEKIKLQNSPRNVTLRSHGRQRYTGLQTEQEGLWAREASMSRAREGWTYYMEESTGTRSTGTVDTNRFTSRSSSLLLFSWSSS